jgi:hypothetical protein
VSLSLYHGQASLSRCDRRRNMLMQSQNFRVFVCSDRHVGRQPAVSPASRTGMHRVGSCLLAPSISCRRPCRCGKSTSSPSASLRSSFGTAHGYHGSVPPQPSNALRYRLLRTAPTVPSRRTRAQILRVVDRVSHPVRNKHALILWEKGATTIVILLENPSY